MPKSIVSSWVQYVNNLRTQGSKTSVHLSPVRLYDYMTSKNKSGQVSLYPQFVLFFTQGLSTAKSVISDLLKDIYTHNPQHLLIEPIKKI
jgi:hypothetical protein